MIILRKVKMLNLTALTTKYRSNLIISTYKNWLKGSVKALDIGCGTGIVSWQLKKHFNLKLIGCDVEKYLRVDINFVLMERPNRLPFKNNSFEMVFFNDVLHHTTKDNQEKLLKEALRVAQKVVIFEDKPTLVNKIFDILLNKIHNPNMSLDLTHRKVREWQTLFKKIGAKVQTVHVKRPTFYPLSHVAFLLTKKKLLV